MGSDRRLPLIASLALLWLAIVVSLYYVNHKPFTVALAGQAAIAMGRIALAGMILSVGGGIGTWLLPGAWFPPLVRIGVQAALGLGVVSLAWLALGSTIGFPAWLLWAALLLPGLMLRKPVIRWWRSWGSLVPAWQRSDPSGRILAVLVAVLVLLSLIQALAPPIKFDALVYHLTLPQGYLAAGRLAYTPDLMYWGMPQLVELLYTWASGLGGAPTAAVLGWGLGLVAILAVVGMGNEYLGVPAGWVSAAALAAGSTLSGSLGWAYVDWGAAMYGSAFLAVLVAWRAGERTALAGLAGLLAGMALGVKYTAGILCLIGGGILLWENRSRGMIAIKLVGIFSISALLVSLPWWVKNLLATGNPFYPFFFPAGAMDALRLSLYQSQPAWGDWREALLLPLRASLAGQEAAPGFGASIGPLLLGLGALFWLVRRVPGTPRTHAVRMAAQVSLGALVIWAVASRLSGLLIQSRLYLAAFPALAVLAGAGYQGLAALRLPGVRVQRVAVVLVILVLALAVLGGLSAVLAGGAPQVLLGVQPEHAYLENQLGWYIPAVGRAKDVPAPGRTLLLWEPRGFYCAPRCEPDEVIDRWLHDVRTFKSPQQVLASWREAGFSHLLLHRAGAEFTRQEDGRYQASDWQALESLLAGLPIEETFGGVYEFYPLGP